MLPKFKDFPDFFYLSLLYNKKKKFVLCFRLELLANFDVLSGQLNSIFEHTLFASFFLLLFYALLIFVFLECT